MAWVEDDSPDSIHRLRRMVVDHRAALQRYLGRMGVPAHETEDAAQEVFLVAASKLDDIPEGGERGFLTATALRIAANARRGWKRRHLAHDRLLDVPEPPTPRPDDLTERMQARNLLDEAMHEMPSELRGVFELHELEEISIGEIAQRLGVAEGTAASRLRRARESFDDWVVRFRASSSFERARASGRHARGRPALPPEIFSWWVSKGEVDALQAVLGLYRQSHPDVPVVSASVRGTESARDKLQTRMARCQPPDTFQANGGNDLLGWVRRKGTASRLAPLDFLVDEGWRRVFPTDVLDLVSDDGRIYGVPIDIHRTNTLFYDKAIFRRFDLDPPRTMDDLVIVAHELGRAGITPLALGALHPWTLTLLAFENVMIAEAGAAYYRDFFAGRRRPRDPEIRHTLSVVSHLIDHANPDAAKLTWDEAVDLVHAGSAAMTIMGDWAKGYLTRKGWRPDVDFGQVEMPGTSDVFVFATDTFGLPTHAANPERAVELLKVFASREGQDAFNPLKGSIPARLDVAVRRYDTMAQSTLRAFRRKPHVASLTSIVPPTFTRALDTAMGVFLRDHDGDRVVDALERNYHLLAGETRRA
jgi:glucose/mannose transport system substrate-binding protein